MDIKLLYVPTEPPEDNFNVWSRNLPYPTPRTKTISLLSLYIHWNQNTDILQNKLWMVTRHKPSIPACRAGIWSTRLFIDRTPHEKSATRCLEDPALLASGPFFPPTPLAQLALLRLWFLGQGHNLAPPLILIFTDTSGWLYITISPVIATSNLFRAFGSFFFSLTFNMPSQCNGWIQSIDVSIHGMRPISHLQELLNETVSSIGGIILTLMHFA